MRLLYTHENRLIVSNIQNIVDAAGIDVTVKNEFASGGVGELSPLSAWLELWVADADYDRASRIIEAHQSAEHSTPWVCPNCGEVNDPSFEICWSCGGESARQ